MSVRIYRERTQREEENLNTQYLFLVRCMTEEKWMKQRPERWWWKGAKRGIHHPRNKKIIW